MFDVKIIDKRKISVKILIGVLILGVAFIFSNTLILTNKIKLHLDSKQSFIHEIKSSQLMEANLLKSHIHSVLPIIKVTTETDQVVAVFNDMRWITGLIIGFDIKNPKTILGNQILLMHQYDVQMVSSLAKVNESDMTYYPVREEAVSENEVKQPVQEVQGPPPKSIDELLGTDYQGLGDSDHREELEPDNVNEITINPVNPKGYDYSRNIYVKNEAGLNVNINELLNEKLSIDLSGKGPKVLIVHTHTSEAYTPTKENFYVPSDPDRTENPKYNVVRVGEEIAKNLKNMGIEVIHDKTIHDYPSYNGSYVNTMKTIQSQIKKNPSICFVLDIHRDGLITEDGKKLKVTAQIDGKKAAQIMFVVGTNQFGLEHPKWRENFKLALKLQEQCNRLYPGLARPIHLTKYRYNQHLTTGSLIIEMGSNGNTLEEALISSEYIAKVFAEVFKKIE